MPLNQVQPRRWRQTSALFAVADALFLMVVGSASNFAMHLAHTLEWSIVVTVIKEVCTCPESSDFMFPQNSPIA